MHSPIRRGPCIPRAYPRLIRSNQALFLETMISCIGESICFVLHKTGPSSRRLVDGSCRRHAIRAGAVHPVRDMK